MRYLVIEVDLRQGREPGGRTVLGRYDNLEAARTRRDDKPRAKGEPWVRGVIPLAEKGEI